VGEPELRGGDEVRHACPPCESAAAAAGWSAAVKPAGIRGRRRLAFGAFTPLLLGRLLSGFRITAGEGKAGRGGVGCSSAGVAARRLRAARARAAGADPP